MIELTRAQARQLRAILRKSLPAGSGRTYHPPLSLHSGEDGLRVRVHNPEVAIEWQLAGPRMAETITLPSSALDDFEGRHEDVVALAANGKDSIHAEWSDGGVPQSRDYLTVERDKLPLFPMEPETFKSLDASFLKMLDDATQTAAKESIRFAVTKIQLRGSTGEVVATDSRQLLLQRGFEFPFKEDVLIPAVNVFGCKELNGEDQLAIGKSEKHVCIRIGAWKFHLLIDADGRFPRYENVIPASANQGVSVCIEPDDATFIAHALPRLPGRELSDQPVTVDLNGHITIRAKDDSQARATELHLDRSQFQGRPMRFVTDRQYLLRAVRLGFSEVQVANPGGLIICRDPRRMFVWMSLNKDSALKPSGDAIRISSSGEQPQTHYSEERTEDSMNDAMTTANGDTNGSPTSAAHANGDDTQPTGFDALIVEAEAIRDVLRDAYARAARLVTGVRRQKKKSRLVRETLASLRQLQTIEN